MLKSEEYFKKMTTIMIKYLVSAVTEILDLQEKVIILKNCNSIYKSFVE